MRCQARQLDSYSSARHCSTAPQLVQLDRPRQTSTDLDRPRRTGAWSQPRQARQARQARPRQQARQRLDSASTEPRQLDSSTARAQTKSWNQNPDVKKRQEFPRRSKTKLRRTIFRIRSVSDSPVSISSCSSATRSRSRLGARGSGRPGPGWVGPPPTGRVAGRRRRDSGARGAGGCFTGNVKLLSEIPAGRLRTEHNVPHRHSGHAGAAHRAERVVSSRGGPAGTHKPLPTTH